MFIRLFPLIFFIAISPFVLADDAVEASSTGNIAFEKTQGLVMKSEVLKITKLNGKDWASQDVNVDVDFHIKNTTDSDIVRKVAFVLPPIYCREDRHYSWRGFKSNHAQTNLDNAFSDFQTFTNGKLQVVHERKEAFKNKRNISDFLNDHEIPLNPCDVLLQGESKPAYYKTLRKKHLLASTGDPIWSMNVFFEWIQTFPAGKTVDIHHIYTTTTGGSVLNPRTISELNSVFTDRDPSLNPIWVRGLDTLENSHPFLVKKINDELHFCVMPKWVRYQLTTGAKWKGGIGRLTLIVKDKSGMPFAINQFYGESDVWSHADNNTAKFVLKDFVPTQNIFIQFLVAPQNEEEKKVCQIS